MTGFSGVVEVIGKMKSKLKRETTEIKQNCLAVDIDLSLTLSYAYQNKKFKISESHYCAKNSGNWK